MESFKIELHLTKELADLLILALAFAKNEAIKRVENEEANCGFEQIGTLGWLTEYIAHKIRDAR